MANLFLTGVGVPTGAIGEITDYYRDTITNLIYYYAPTGWEVVPSLVPTPDGVGTNWLFGTGAPDNGIGSANDYYRDDANGSVYRKHAVNGWEAKGSLDFIGVYGVQWGEGTGAPANIESLNNLPAGSFYLDVATSDIYYKDETLTWSLKGQLGGGGGGGGVTVVDNLTSTSTTDALSANQGKALKDTKAPIDSPTFTGTPTAPTPATEDADTKIATMEAVHAVAANALTIANSRYQFVSDAGTTYTVPASAVTANGNTIIELSNNSLTSITINAATATGKTAGDSVTIHITGTYAAQLLVADGVTLNGTLAFSDNAKIKTLIYRGSNTWTVLGG